MSFDSLNTPIFMGIDACKASWFVIGINCNGEWAMDIFAEIGQVWRRLQAASPVMLIDIPIGIPEKDSRICDGLARKLLKRRGSSVFPVPCRKALTARTYQAACRVNYKQSGKKLSVQSWNIMPKIKEVDILIQGNSAAREKIRESHPEVCFWALSGGRPMELNKKTRGGYLERRDVLQSAFFRSKEIIKSARATFPRKSLAMDDILDALVLSVTAAAPSKSMRTLPENPPSDARRLPMEIVYSAATCTSRE